MGIIRIEEMEFFSYHGCFTEERVIGTRFLADISLEVDTHEAEKSDNLKNTVNYQAVYHVIKTEMEIKSHLLEHVSRRILDAIFNRFPAVSSATIKISKLNPALGGKMGCVSITLSHARDEMPEGTSSYKPKC
jgi:7,8-dihydroneopterin aldolase/epimerase/oxygenase